jgi:hypothetical protein
VKVNDFFSAFIVTHENEMCATSDGMNVFV